MDLVRDVLDKAVVDRNGHEMGRVDAIVIELREDRPPLVRAIEIGPVALASRLHPRLGRIVAAAEAWLGLSDQRPVRIPFTRVEVRDNKVAVDLTAGETASSTIELAVRRVLRNFVWK